MLWPTDTKRTVCTEYILHVQKAAPRQNRRAQPYDFPRATIDISIHDGGGKDLRGNQKSEGAGSIPEWPEGFS